MKKDTMLIVAAAAAAYFVWKKYGSGPVDLVSTITPIEKRPDTYDPEIYTRFDTDIPSSIYDRWGYT